MSSTFLEFTAGTGFGFTILLAILFLINSPVTSVEDTKISKNL